MDPRHYEWVGSSKNTINKNPIEGGKMNSETVYICRINREHDFYAGMRLKCQQKIKGNVEEHDNLTFGLKLKHGWTTDDLVFEWKEGDPVQVVKNLHLPRFTLEKFETDYCNSKTNTGEYSCLKVDLLFKREFSYYLIQIYIPCCMLVIVSWVSFWLDQSAVPARVSLGVTTLLTMATQTSGINASLPPVSYTKAIDVWTGVCLTFVFGALLEFALVNYASRSDMHRENMKKKYREIEHSSSVDPATELLEADGSTNFQMQQQQQQHHHHHHHHHHEQQQQQQQQHHHTHRHRQRHRQPQSPTSSSQTENEAQCSPEASQNSRITSRSSHSPSSSRMATPSPPVLLSRANDTRRFPRLQLCNSEKTYIKRLFTCHAKGSARIDVIARFAFPLMFVFFNFAYWSMYLFREADDPSKMS
ncbi:hypothetical protein PV327_003861 [Microctonus hyperodae]|uniref:Neurotransmitter-gated ion-channel transmembrane domain-containing protein n=1 Tax=Microctonus hyperodae TaxID=165561 RepID=A0AA39G4V5_MICHY|nr:hypothetical protein PV327_003861 [Microctonus hyperodae]